MPGHSLKLFSLFTTRTNKPSLRLTLLARGFQALGIVTGVSLAGIAIYRQFFLDHTHTPRWAFTPLYSYFALSALSSFLIGRGLLRRQRWGAYLAGVTIAAPFVQQLLNPDANILSVPQLALSTLALCAIVTVWDELGNARDADFEDESGHDHALATDAEGEIGGAAYAAPRLLIEPIPTMTSPTASTPLPINKPRAS